MTKESQLSSIQTSIDKNTLEEYALLIIGQAYSRTTIDRFGEVTGKDGTTIPAVIPDDERHADERELAKMKERFARDHEKKNPQESLSARQNKARADALEVLIADTGEGDEWFGESVFLARTSEFDDIKNGIDMVAEFLIDSSPDGEDGGVEYLALAIDASMRGDVGGIADKINRNIEKIENRRSREVKYFESTRDGSRMRLPMVIPVVIGIDSHHADDLIATAGSIIKMKKSDATGNERMIKERTEAIQNHFCQIAFLKEIIAQLALYAQIIENEQSATAQEDIKIITRLRKNLSATLRAKQEIARANYDTLGNDNVLQNIETVCLGHAKHVREERRGAVA